MDVFIHPLNKYSVSIYYVPDMMLDITHTEMNESSLSVHTLVQEMDRKNYGRVI